MELRGRFEEIKYAYIALHTSLFFAFLMIGDNLTWKFKFREELDNLIRTGRPIEIQFDNGKCYELRLNDYAKYGVNSAYDRSDRTLWVLWEMAILQSFMYISAHFSEMLDEKNPDYRTFETFVREKLEERGQSYRDFYTLIRLIRNVSVHNSFTKTATLRLDNIKVWKKKCEKEKISRIGIRLMLTDKQYFEIRFWIDEIQEGINLSEIFNTHTMLMFIETCMQLIWLFKESKQDSWEIFFPPS